MPKKTGFKSGIFLYNASIDFEKELLMKKNPAFEHWIADHMMDGMIMMEPYGYREDGPGNFLHLFRISLQFADEPEPFEGVAWAASGRSWILQPDLLLRCRL